MDHKSHGSDQYVSPHVTSAKLPARFSTLQNVIEQRKVWYFLAYVAGVVSVVMLRLEHRKTFLIAISSGYLFIVQVMRFDRKKSLEKEFGYVSRDSFGKMTLNEAHAIHKALVELEFPILFHKALEFALFRTYGIPTVSKLLVETTQLTKPSTAPKRYADTKALILEFAGNDPASDRCIDAIARMNYIHSVHQKNGKISNDDMLYTLSLFAREPVRWIKKYEWRDLSGMETCAIGTFWKAIGDAMFIDFSKLPSGKTGWKDGLHWHEEISDWSDEYEKEKMVPDPNNRKTADQTIELLIWAMPTFLKPIGYSITCVMMDDRLRSAMMYEKPGPGYYNFLDAVLTLRKTYHRYLALPRPEFMRRRHISEEPNQEGRFNLRYYGNAPYYIWPSLSERWSMQAWLYRMLGKPVPGDDNDKYSPKGYHIGDIGPNQMVGKGMDSTSKIKANLKKRNRGGCPFPM